MTKIKNFRTVEIMLKFIFIRLCNIYILKKVIVTKPQIRFCIIFGYFLSWFFAYLKFDKV